MILFAGLAAGLGAGVLSVFFFLCLVAGIPAVVALLPAAAAIAALWRFGPRSLPRSPREPLETILRAAFWLLLAAAIGGLYLEYSNTPGGGWDAWSIWNLRARFLFRGAAHWRESFSPLLEWSHPDYPLLVPGLTAFLWKLMGSESTWAPALAGGLFTLGTPLVITGAIQRLRGPSAGYLAGIFLLGTPFFILHGASQYADVPLAFYIAAAVAMLAVDQPVLAGLCAGLAAWTKNEGLLFAAVLIAARIGALLLTRRALFGELRRYLTGLAPGLAIYFWFRTSISTGKSALGSTLHFDHLGTIAGAFASHLATFGQLLITPAVFLALYIWLAKPDIAKHRSAVYTSGLALLLQLAGYAGFYLLWPGDLPWLIGTTMDRLLLQVWPLAILTAFLLARGAAQDSLQRVGHSQ